MNILRTGLVFFLPVLVFAQTPSAEQSHFQLAQFRVRGQIEEVIPADLDGDDLKELIVTHHSNPPGGINRRYLSVYWQDKRCQYLPGQSVEVEIPQRFTVYDFGRIPNEPNQVIVMLSKTSAEYYQFAGKVLKGPIQMFRFGSQLLQIPDPERILYNDFLSDWNRDGRDELMVYQMDEAEIFYSKDNKWISKKLDIPMEARYFSITPLRKLFPHSEINVSYQSPDIFVADREGDGKPELFAISDERLWIYKLNEDGIYNQFPAYKIYINLKNPADRVRQRAQLTLQVADIDNDAKADLVSNYQSGGFFNQKADLRIFLGKDQWATPNKPLKASKSFSFSSWVIGPFIKDVNADGNNDLIIPTISIGVISAAQVLITNNFPIEFSYYISNSNSFSSQPDYSDKIDIHFDFGQGKILGGFPQIFGDFNGDGIDDLLYSKSEQEMVVVLKDKSGKRTAQQEIIKIPSAIIPAVEDLNNDKKDDIILVYPQDPERQGEFKVLINKGRW